MLMTWADLDRSPLKRCVTPSVDCLDTNREAARPLEDTFTRRSGERLQVSLS